MHSLISRLSAECICCSEFGLRNLLIRLCLSDPPTYVGLYFPETFYSTCALVSITNFLMLSFAGFFLFVCLFLTWYPDLNRSGVKETC